MKKYQILGTTADIKLRVKANSLEQLFEQAALGMMEILGAEIKDTEKLRNKEIEIRSSNINSLLIDFLNEILYRVGVDKEVYNDFEVKIRNNIELICRAKATSFERLDLEIKAATYSDLKIEKDKNGKWQVEVLFDI